MSHRSYPYIKSYVRNYKPCCMRTYIEPVMMVCFFRRYRKPLYHSRMHNRSTSPELALETFAGHPLLSLQPWLLEHQLRDFQDHSPPLSWRDQVRSLHQCLRTNPAASEYHSFLETVVASRPYLLHLSPPNLAVVITIQSKDGEKECLN